MKEKMKKMKILMIKIRDIDKKNVFEDKWINNVKS